jgi:lipopolysaccharide/colanic/teichoic acid biosynthesis glycosyltransferase
MTIGNQGLPRWAEIALAGAGLWATLPVIAACAVVVKATSTGPAFFQQDRVGRFGHSFRLVKLRTMTVNNTGIGVTAKDDKRITAVGKMLRKTKLDELPELWNVLRGDMSFVGPRPEVPRYVDVTSPLWREVLCVRPGLTDPVTLRLRNEEELLASIDGDRERFYRDVLQTYKLRGYAAYLRARSPAADIGVLVRTVAAVVRPGLTPPPTLDEINATVTP